MDRINERPTRYSAADYARMAAATARHEKMIARKAACERLARLAIVAIAAFIAFALFYGA